MKNLLTLTLFISIIFSVPAQLVGTYTINNQLPTKKTNFNNFTEATNALRFQGVDGDVVFNISSGIYYEPLVFESISNDLDFKVTFQAENNSNVEFMNDGIGLLISNSDNIVINNIKFKSKSTEISSIAIISNSNKTILQNSKFISESIRPNFKSAVSITSTSNNNVIDDNILKAATGIEINRLSNNNVIKDNDIMFEDLGIELLSSLNTSISSNIIKGYSEPGNTAIQMDGYVGNLNIASNKISNTNFGMNQILTYRPSNNKVSGKIVNNVIESVHNNLVFTNNIKGLQIAFNTLTSSEGIVLSMNEEIAATISEVELFANSMMNNSEELIVSISNSSSFTKVNHNNVFSTKGEFTINIDNGVKTSLEEWTTVMQANNTISANPEYALNENNNYFLYENSPCINAVANAAELGVVTDVEGEFRGAFTTIGAIEYNSSSNAEFARFSELIID